ncbi:MAG TPA: carboxymuconolactone decarboxylase family protein [Pseudonocardia sp.]|jgi:AhpD family alkylhydroperoxidase|uniref:carboxymuconolactone decarboxylase family protein n=1 Tax=Pseudonocardia sp. TaxID=60912 RepID=UPI002F40E93D
MTERIQLNSGIPPAFAALRTMASEVSRAAAAAGLDERVLELVKIRGSQINGCAFCLDMHTTDAIKHGEDPRRLFLLDAWRETDLYDEQERAALELTEAITRLPDTQDVSDEVYQRAVKVFDDAQYQAVAWMAVVINTFNRLAVTGRAQLPRRAS